VSRSCVSRTRFCVAAQARISGSDEPAKPASWTRRTSSGGAVREGYLRRSSHP
jgi:hypothetical protein